MSYLIPFNINKIEQNSYNNVFVHSFRGSAVNLKGAEIAIHSISMYNSVFNIDSSAYGNNTFSIIMPTAATTTTIDITLPDGLYDYAAISGYIQSQLVNAGAYLIDGDGNFRHYIQISENRVYYSCQIDLSPLPTSLPAGWSRPTTGLYSSTGTGLPTTTRTPIININNSEFGKIIGFRVAQYPSSTQTTLQSFLSNITPMDVLGTFDNAGTSSGQLISYKPSQYAYIPISDGSYSNIRLTIVDQEERFVRIKDPNIQIVLAIREKPWQ